MILCVKIKRKERLTLSYLKISFPKKVEFKNFPSVLEFIKFHTRQKYRTILFTIMWKLICWLYINWYLFIDLFIYWFIWYIYLLILLLEHYDRKLFSFNNNFYNLILFNNNCPSSTYSRFCFQRNWLLKICQAPKFCTEEKV